MKSYAVIFTYSFDDDTAVYLFDSEKEAVDFLRGSVMEEFRIDTEENGWDSSCNISDDGYYGEIKTNFFDRIDITEARIGHVYSAN